MPLLTESLALFRAQDDQQGIAWILKHLGALANDQGNYPRAKALLEESLAHFQQLGDKWGIADALHTLGINARLQGDDARALALEQESLTHCREQGFKGLIPSVLIGLGTSPGGKAMVRGPEGASRRHWPSTGSSATSGCSW
jgi:hypothetical protein